MHEHGLQDRENSLLYTKKPRCSAGAGGQFVSVGMVDIEPALYLIIWGFGLSVLVFMLEWLFVHGKKYFWKKIGMQNNRSKKKIRIARPYEHTNNQLDDSSFHYTE